MYYSEVALDDLRYFNANTEHVLDQQLNHLGLVSLVVFLDVLHLQLL